MNKSIVFKLSHQLAKVIRTDYGSYRDAFAAALRAISAHKSFYNMMAFRLTAIAVVEGAQSSANHHTYFLGNSQYSIQFASTDEIKTDGYWAA